MLQFTRISVRALVFLTLYIFSVKSLRLSFKFLSTKVTRTLFCEQSSESNFRVIRNTAKKIFKKTLIASTISTAFSLPFAAFSKTYNKLMPSHKLATTPVFYLANSGGNPYMQEDMQAGNLNQRVFTYFLSSEDALGYLNEVSQGNPSNVNEFRIMVTTLEKVLV